MLYFPPSDYNHKLVGRRGKIVCSSTRFKGAWVCQTGKECWVNKSCMSNEDSDIASSFSWARSTAPDVWEGEIGDFSSSDIIQSLQLSLYSLPMTVGCIDIQIQGEWREERSAEKWRKVRCRRAWLTDLLLQGEEAASSSVLRNIATSVMAHTHSRPSSTAATSWQSSRYSYTFLPNLPSDIFRHHGEQATAYKQTKLTQSPGSTLRQWAPGPYPA